MNESEYVCGSPGRRNELPIVLSGCSGGGKSTLLSEMSRRGYTVQPEPGRQIVMEQMAICGDGVPWENVARFVDLTLSRAMYLYNSTPDAGATFVDRSILDCAAACKHLFGRVPDHVENAVALYRYFPTVFMVPPWKEIFSTDRERKHGFADAVAEYERLIPFYETNGYRIVRVPMDTVANRADFLEQYLRTSTD